MIENAKIQFSAEELQLLKNRDWILTKNRIIEKISAGLEQLAIQLRDEMLAFYPLLAAEVVGRGFKVSRGEKYQGLPYLMLDFPRIFGKEDILAIRVLFWWGQYYSITLHTKGCYANNLCRVLEQGRYQANSELLISFSGDEWNHDLEHSDYGKLCDYNYADLKMKIRNAGFLKISRCVDLKQWEKVAEELSHEYHQLLPLAALSFQYDGKDP